MTTLFMIGWLLMGCAAAALLLRSVLLERYKISLSDVSIALILIIFGAIGFVASVILFGTDIVIYRKKR